MAKNILVATSQPAFGELLRLSLEESGRYRVRLVQTGREALSSAAHILFSLAILDTTLDEPPFLYVVQGLRKHQPGVRLLVIPSHEGEAAPDVVAAQPDGCIYQPFYAPSLLETIHALTEESSVPTMTEGEKAPKTTLPPAPVPPAGNVQPILQDAALATQHLEEFLKDSTAPGVILLRMRQPWASAGQLNQEALNEVASLLTRYTTANEGVDLARYVHLQSDGSEYLIYATPLVDSQVLAMVYQITTPLTVIRAQAGRLARLLRQAAAARQAEPVALALSAAPVAEMIASRETPLDEGGFMEEAETADAVLEAEAMRLADLLTELPTPDPQGASPTELSDWVKEAPASGEEDAGFTFPWERQEPSDSTVPAPPVVQPPVSHGTGPAQPANMPIPPASQTAPQAPEREPEPTPLASPANPPEPIQTEPTPPPPVQPGPVLSVPAILTPAQPQPSAKSIEETSPIAAPILPEPALANQAATQPLPPVFPWDRAAPVAPQGPPTPVSQAQKVAGSQAEAATAVASASLAQTTALPVAPVAFPNMPAPRNPEPAAIEQTRPVLSRTQLIYPPGDAGMPTFSILAYTCLLLPRLPSHALVGFIAQRLHEWLPQLCMAYGWRLEGMFVQPEYLQWTVQVAPAISPGNVVRLIRQQTSRRVFMQFPQLEVENPSGDFWASGYLIISGSQLPSPNLAQDFIRQTRLRQGSMYS